MVGDRRRRRSKRRTKSALHAQTEPNRTEPPFNDDTIRTFGGKASSAFLIASTPLLISLNSLSFLSWSRLIRAARVASRTALACLRAAFLWTSKSVTKR